MNITLPLKQSTILAEREEALSRGDEQFEDWEIARQKIEREIR